MPNINLTLIAFDAGTQIREAISEQVVGDYAERMSEGATFPPVVLFADGCCRTDGSVIYYLADGFHRLQAARRNGFVDIDADVRAGTKEDALWFALGANKANGHRMTAGDKRHAILLALQTWPERSINQIAEQIGVNQRYASGIRNEVSATTNLPDRVTGKDGKSYPSSHRVPLEKIAVVEEKLRAGIGVTQIATELRMNTPTVRKIQAAAGLTVDGVDKSRSAVDERRERMRQMAADGFTSRQIADEVGLTFEGCRNALNTAQIDVPADAVIGKARYHDASRIVSQMVMDAENLTADVNLIDFSALDRAQIAGWIESLNASRSKFGAFIKRLMQEQQNGKAA